MAHEDGGPPELLESYLRSLDGLAQAMGAAGITSAKAAENVLRLSERVHPTIAQAVLLAEPMTRTGEARGAKDGGEAHQRALDTRLAEVDTWPWRPGTAGVGGPEDQAEMINVACTGTRHGPCTAEAVAALERAGGAVRKRRGRLVQETAGMGNEALVLAQAQAEHEARTSPRRRRPGHRGKEGRTR